MQRLKSWLSSLHLRLIVGFTLVLVVSLLGVSLYVRYATEREIERYQQEVEQARAERIQWVVNQYYENNKDLSGLGPTLEQAKWLYNWNIELTDANGMPVALVSGQKTASPTQDRRPVPAFDRDQNTSPGPGARRIAGDGNRFRKHIYNLKDGDKNDVASIAMGPADIPGSVPEPPVSRLLATLDASLFWTGIAAGIAGIALVSLLSRRALLSIGVLRGAARTFGSGQYSHRVPQLGTHEIGELGATFNSMADDIQRAERQRLNLMADVAHELRTPLSNIQGYVEAMKDGVINPSDETLESIHQQVLQLNHLVEDVKLLSLLDAGVLRLNFEKAPIGDLLKRSASGFTAKARSKEIRLTTEIDEDIPPVRMDTARILQVVDNLLENAVRHTPHGGEVTVRAGLYSTDEIFVTVEDTGDGIPNEVIDTIFDRFRRADPARTRATGGAGLGLAIAKNLVEAHGGRIEATTSLGGGTTFRFTIPTDQERVSRD
ncbi:MAG: HAMP domain-containing sensor histidine kinase [Chloroflexi bacterium]|nr:HAMP domain-containing sensor histidine kinase [Chloroflexota bacterium]